MVRSMRTRVGPRGSATLVGMPINNDDDFVGGQLKSLSNFAVMCCDNGHKALCPLSYAQRETLLKESHAAYS